MEKERKKRGKESKRPGVAIFALRLALRVARREKGGWRKKEEKSGWKGPAGRPCRRRWIRFGSNDIRLAG